MILQHLLSCMDSNPGVWAGHQHSPTRVQAQQPRLANKPSSMMGSFNEHDTMDRDAVGVGGGGVKFSLTMALYAAVGYGE